MSYFDVFGELGDEPPPPSPASAPAVDTAAKRPPSASTNLPSASTNGNDVLRCDQCGENSGVGDGRSGGEGDVDDGAVDQSESGGGDWRSNDATPTPPDGGTEDSPPEDTSEPATTSSDAAESTENTQDPPLRTTVEPAPPKVAPDGRMILPRLRLTSVDDNGEPFDVDDDVFFSGAPLEEPLDEEDDAVSTPDTDITEAAELALKEPPAEDSPWSSHLPMRLFRDGWHGLSNLLVSIHHHRRASDG